MHGDRASRLRRGGESFWAIKRVQRGNHAYYIRMWQARPTVALVFLMTGVLAGYSQASKPAEPFGADKPVSEWVMDLRSQDGHQVYNAFLALEGLGARSESAVPQLLALLKDPDASFVVTNLRPPGHILGPAQSFKYANLAKQTLVAIGSGAVTNLLKALDEDSPPLQHSAAVVLGRIAKEGKPGLSGDPRVVTKALSAYLQKNASSLSVDDLKAIGFGKSPDAVQELVLRLKRSPNYETRAWSALALGELKAPESLTALKEALAADHDSLVRQFSAKALGDFDLPAETSDALAVALAKDKEGEVRAACAMALKGTRSPRPCKLSFMRSVMLPRGPTQRGGRVLAHRVKGGGPGAHKGPEK